MSLLLGYLSPALPLKASGRPGGQPQDKSAAVSQLKVTATQEGQPAPDLSKLKLEQSFKLKFSFAYKILKDEFIPDYEAAGVTAENTVNEHDFADLKLGFNLALADQAKLKTPVYDVTTKQKVGVITITNNGEGETTARMDFESDPNDPNGQFVYEPDSLQELTVEFEGEFRAAKTESSTPPTDNDYLQILDQKIGLPKKQAEEKVSLNKSGAQSSDGTIIWEVTAQRKLGDQAADLKGFVLKDDLSKVGEPVADSVTLNGQPLDLAAVYNADSKQLQYTFPEDSTGEQKLSFKTKIDWAGAAEVTVKNKAVLENPNGEPSEKEVEVPVSRKVPISKGFKGVDVSVDNDEKAFLWTIEAGKKGFNYGPAWIADITMSKPGIPAPKRVELTVERQQPDGKWVPVELDQTKITAPDRPAVPVDQTAGCPVIPAAYKVSDIYDFGPNFQQPTVIPPEGLQSTQSNWYFLPELDGLWRLTMKQIFASDQEIPSGALANHAEIHICGGYNFPVTPPIYSGSASIRKSALSSGEYNVYGKAPDLRQGILPWDITVDLTKVFPTVNTYAYDFFFYGTEDEYTAVKADLTLGGTPLPTGSFDALRQLLPKGDKHDYNKPYCNYNMAYVKDSFKSSDDLKATVIPVMHNGKQVGDLVQISGFKDPKSYQFSLKGQMQNLAELTAGRSYINTGNLRNTAVLATGEGQTLKTLSATSYYQFDALLYKKTALEHTVNLDDTSDHSVSRRAKNSSSYYEFYMGHWKTVDPDKVFNYQDLTAYFRIDLNILGTNWGQYLADLKKPLDPKPDYTKLSVTDVLPEDWTLEPIDDQNNMFALYEADPAEHIAIEHGGITIADSASHARFFYDAKATKRVSADEAKRLVSFDPATGKWTVDGSNGKTYMLVLKAKLNKDAFTKLAEDLSQQEPAKSYTNQATVYVQNTPEMTVDDQVKVKPGLLEKEAPVWEGDGTADTAALTWTVHHRPYHKDYKGAVLVDVLDENLSLPMDANGKPKLDSIKTYSADTLQADGLYADYREANVVLDGGKDTNSNAVRVSYDAAKHELTFKLPDNQPGAKLKAWKLTYKTLLEPSQIDSETLVNKLKLKVNNQTLPGEGFWEESLGKSVAWARLKQFPLYVFQKQAAGETGEALPGATFELRQNDTVLATKTTNRKGQILLFNLADGDYVLKETSAPEGYTQRTDEIRFTIENQQLKLADSTAADVTGEGSRSNPVIVTNAVKPPDPTTTPTTTPSATSSTTSSTTGTTKPTGPSSPKTPTGTTGPWEKPTPPMGKTGPGKKTTPTPGKSKPRKLVRTGQATSPASYLLLLAAVPILLYVRKRNKAEQD